MNFAKINKTLIEPTLRGELLPQLMLSDYDLITEDLSRIIRIEELGAIARYYFSSAIKKAY